MKVPNRESAEAYERKLLEYLLNPLHPVGGSKAAFFIKHGFRPDRWEVLRDALLRHLHENEVLELQQTLHGTRFIVDGPLVAPDGTVLNIRCIWFIELQNPRFVTAHPLPKP